MKDADVLSWTVAYLSHCLRDRASVESAMVIGKSTIFLRMADRERYRIDFAVIDADRGDELVGREEPGDIADPGPIGEAGDVARTILHILSLPKFRSLVRGPRFDEESRDCEGAFRLKDVPIHFVVDDGYDGFRDMVEASAPPAPRLVPISIADPRRLLRLVNSIGARENVEFLALARISDARRSWIAGALCVSDRPFRAGGPSVYMAYEHAERRRIAVIEEGEIERLFMIYEGDAARLFPDLDPH